MHLDVLLRDAFFDQEHGDLLTLIALKLDHLAKFLVIDDGAVASKLLLERLEKLFFGRILRSVSRLCTYPWADLAAS